MGVLGKIQGGDLPIPFLQRGMQLVVDGTSGGRLTLNEAPRIEEDWGE